MKISRLIIGSGLALFLLFAGSAPAWAHKQAYERFGVVYPNRVKEAPDFKLRDLKGNKISLQDLKGKPILLNFWATWCEACKQELPSMQRLHEDMRKEGIQVVAISIDRADASKVQKYVDQYKLTFPVLLDPEQQVRKGYFILGLPTSYLIDADGKLRGFISGARKWDSRFSKDVMRVLLRDFSAER